MTAPMFKVFTDAMIPYTASVDGVTRKFIKATASSTVTDRKGHEFDLKALHKMGATAKGMTIFLNHEYRVPEDLFGTVVDADAKHTGFDENNDAIWDLSYNVMVNEANPRAVQAWDSYQQGVRMGVSVGVLVKKWEKSPKDAEIKRITDVENLEASIVGIPANPRTWVGGAIKSINAFTTLSDEGMFETLDLLDNVVSGPDETNAVWDSAYVNALPNSAFACPEERKYPHHDKSGALDLPHLRAALSRVGDPSNDQCGKAHLQAHAKAAGVGDSEDKSMYDIERYQKDAPSPENTLEDDEEHQHREGESDAPIDPTNDDSLAGQELAKSDTDEANTDAAEDLAETRDPEASASGATLSAPESESETQPEASVAAGIDAIVSAYKAQVQDRDDQIATLTKERDEAREASRTAMEIVERISSLPLGRKASFQHEVKSFRTSLSGVYGDDFLAFLDERNAQ